MLIGLSEQEVATTWDSLITHWHNRGWELKLTKTQGSLTSVKFLGEQWCGICKVKDKLLHLSLPATNKEAQCLVSLFVFRRQHIPHSGVLLWLIYRVTLRAVSFVRNLEQSKALQQVQVAVKAALPLKPCDPADSMVFEVSVAERDAIWRLWQALGEKHRR